MKCSQVCVCMHVCMYVNWHEQIGMFAYVFIKPCGLIHQHIFGDGSCHIPCGQHAYLNVSGEECEFYTMETELFRPGHARA